MVILVDTNIIIDALANREPYADDAKRIMEKCAAREITGILAAHSIPNLFYILRKNFSQEERRFLLKNLCEIFQISDLNEKKIVAALETMYFQILKMVCRKNVQLSLWQIILLHEIRLILSIQE